MRKLLISVIFLTSTTSFADIFSKNSILPLSLQEQVLVVIKKNCPNVALDNLVEVETSVEKVSYDQVKLKQNFTTNLLAQYVFDGNHPSNIEISIDSTQISTDSEVENTALLHLSSSDPAACEFF